MPVFTLTVINREELSQARESAKNELDRSVDLTQYRAEQKKAIEEILAQSKEAIEAAADKESIDKLVEEAKQKIGSVKTGSQIDAEELSQAKEAAKNELDRSVDLTQYRAEQRKAIEEILAQSKGAIEAAADKGSIDRLVEEAKQKIGSVKTGSQMDVEELAQAKEAAKNELDGSVDLTQYRAEQKKAIEEILAQSKEAIEAAADKGSIDRLVEEAKQEIGSVKTGSQMDAEELAQAKEAAKNELDGSVDLMQYGPKQKKAIEEILAQSKEAIEVAADKESIDRIVEEAKQEIGSIKTGSQIEAEELSQAKEAAKNELDGSVDLTQYRAEQKKAIEKILAQSREAIGAAADKGSIDRLVEEAKQKIRSIKTGKQMDAEELAQARKAAVNALDAYKDLSDYRKAEKDKLKDIIRSAKRSISKAPSKEKVSQAVKNAKKQMDQVLTAKELGQVLTLKMTAKTTAVRLDWNAVKGADKYDIYGAKRSGSCKLLKTVSSKTKTWTDKKLKKASFYKYYVRAYKVVNGKKVIITRSDTMHIATQGGKYGNAKAITVNKSDISIKKGKTSQLKVSVRNTKGSVKMPVTTVRYQSDDTTVAVVSKRGTITGKKKGTCYVYCYTHNGLYKKVKVTVR